MPTENLKPKSIGKKAKKRIPFHERKRIGIEQEEGYTYRLTTDLDDQVHHMKEGGWEVVYAPVREGDKTSSDPSQLGKIARQSVGQGEYGVYMRIPTETWEADQAKKQIPIDEFDARIGATDDQATYLTKSGKRIRKL